MRALVALLMLERRIRDRGSAGSRAGMEKTSAFRYRGSRHRLAACLVASAFALGLAACGDDDDKAKTTSATTGETGISEPSITGSTGSTAGSTGATGKQSKKAKRRRAATGGVTVPSTGHGVAPLPSRRSLEGGKRKGGRRGATYKSKYTARQIYVFAKALCQYNTKKSLADQYKLKTRDPKRIAREYAIRGFPRELRHAAYTGCVAGFKHPKT
jgi:hypothetical protein